jgi:hypothetical protein
MNPIIRSVCLSVWSLALLALAGCDQGASGAKPATDTEQVQLKIENVPPEVACLRITASGASREVVRDLDVVEGQNVVESMGGLPVGKVVFQALAYAQVCDSVTKTTVPSWVSDQVPVNVTLSQSKSVSLTLYRNGRAKVTVGFDPETPDAGTADGV